MNCFSSALERALFTDVLIVLTISRAVPVGAKRPHQFAYSKPGTPDSAIAGRPGISGVGFGLLTASPRTLPALICDITAGELAMIASTSPEASAMTAGAM